MKSSTITRAVDWVRRKNNSNALDFTFAIQRKEVWNLEHKGNFIGAILQGIPIESLLFEEDANNEGCYLVLDGKQRLTTLLQYMKDEFVVTNKCKIQEVDGISIVDKKFSELPEFLQERLKEYELNIAVMRPMTEDERELLFYMRNQAVSLTKIELTRVLMGSEALRTITALAQHPIIKKLNLSSSKSYRDQQVIMEILVLETGKNMSFEGSALMKFAEECKREGINKEVTETLIKVFDYLDAVIPKKMPIAKVHIPMLYLVAKRAMADNVDGEVFFKWIKKFFKENKGADSEYSKACDSGLLQKSKIQTRIKLMTDHYINNINSIL